MKRIIGLVVFALLVTAPALSQTTGEMARKIRTWYNAEQADSIWLAADSNFQSKLSMSEFENALKAQLFPYGDIVGFGYSNTLNGNVDRYRLTTEKGLLLQMLLQQNEKGQISTLFLQPWKEDVRERKDSLWYDNARSNDLDILVHDAAMQYLKSSNTPGLSILVLQGTKANYYNYGWARESTAQYPTPQMLYEIGSITKTLTGFVLADAVVSGKVKLTDPITKYLPDSVSRNRNLKDITLVQLSNHTSGLPRLATNYLEGSTRFYDPYASYGDNLLFKYLRTATLESKPGTQYSYSNLAVGLLGVIMEKVYRKPLQQIYSELIFEPFRMRSTTSLSLSDTTLAAGAHNALGYPTWYWNFQSMAAAGSVKSNLEDMARYCMQFTLRPRVKNNQPDPRILLLDSITYSHAATHISLGWFFDKPDGPNRSMYHSGGTGGFRTHVKITPDRKEAIVVLANSAEEPGAPALAENISKLLLQKFPGKPNLNP